MEAGSIAGARVNAQRGRNGFAQIGNRYHTSKPGFSSTAPCAEDGEFSESGKRRIFAIGKRWESMFADRFVWLLAKTS